MKTQSVIIFIRVYNMLWYTHTCFQVQVSRYTHGWEYLHTDFDPLQCNIIPINLKCATILWRNPYKKIKWAAFHSHHLN